MKTLGCAESVTNTPFTDHSRFSSIKLSRRKFLIASLSLGAASLAYGFNETRVVEVTRLRAGLGGKLVFLTDQHIHGWGETERHIVSIVNNENPDVVILGGDIIDELTRDLKPVKLYLESIRARELYAVLGNHDYRSGKARELVGLLTELGYEVLVDSWSSSRFMGSVYGVNWRDSRAYPRIKARGQLIVSHDPNAALVVEGENLVLSGHTHGGLVVFGIVLFTNSSRHVESYAVSQPVKPSSKLGVCEQHDPEHY
jgi:predicted MPP superfamily phosphohydrolase